MQTETMSSIDIFDEAVDSLSHHGILGQRWGRKQGPPYPLDEGDHSSSEKKAGWRKSLESVADRFRKKKDTAPDADVKKAEPQKEETLEERKAREAREKKAAIASGDATLVKKYADQLTYQELNEAVNRVNLMQRLDQMTPKEDTQNKIDKALQVIDENATRVKKGVDTYNKVADIYNRFADPPLPLINESLADKRKKESEEKEKKIREKALDELKKDPTKWEKNIPNLKDEELQQLANRAGMMNKMKTQLGQFYKDPNQNQNNQQQNQQSQQQSQKQKQNDDGGNKKGNSGNQTVDIRVHYDPPTSNEPKQEEPKQKSTEKQPKYKMTKEQVKMYNDNVARLENEARQRRIDQMYKDEVYNEAVNSLLGRESTYNRRSLDDIEKYGFSHSDDESDLPSFEDYADRLLEAIRA